tara:strand:+ start:3966 stop:4325 length:360 start_codon:yes stop_codon:yes gene_type:complete
MKDLNSANQTPTISKTFAASSQRVLTVDVERYQSYLDGLDVSDERKEEFLRAMFSIVMTFVELGFGVSPTQQVQGPEPCGKDEKSENQRPKDGSDGVTSEATPEIEAKNKTGPEGRLEV